MNELFAQAAAIDNVKDAARFVLRLFEHEKEHSATDAVVAALKGRFPNLFRQCRERLEESIFESRLLEISEDMEGGPDLGDD